MLFGQIQFIYGGKYLKGVGDLIIEEKQPGDTTNHLGRIFKNPVSMIVTLVLFGFGVYTLIETSTLFGILTMVAAIFKRYFCLHQWHNFPHRGSATCQHCLVIL